MKFRFLSAFFLTLSCFLIVGSSFLVKAQEITETLEATAAANTLTAATEYQPIAYQAEVKQILESGTKSSDGQEYRFQKLQLEISNKDEKGKFVEVTTDYQLQTQARIYEVGDQVMLNKNRDYSTGADFYVISDVIRLPVLYALFALFVLVVLLTAGVWGLRSLIAMFISFVIIFTLLLPQIMAGHDPVLVSIASAFLLLPTIFFISHGFNAKTFLALGATFAGLLFSIFMAQLFVHLAALTGYASEEAGFLQVEKNGTINIQALLLAGIVIGTFGILDDVAVSQVSVVEQIFALRPGASLGQLYQKAMKVGQDHISSMINTLVLVYAGGSLALLLLFLDSSKSIAEILNQEIVAEEIVKTLIGSITLVLIAPISTFVAAWYYAKFAKPLPPEELPEIRHEHS